MDSKREVLGIWTIRDSDSPTKIVTSAIWRPYPHTAFGTAVILDDCVYTQASRAPELLVSTNEPSEHHRVVCVSWQDREGGQYGSFRPVCSPNRRQAGSSLVTPTAPEWLSIYPRLLVWMGSGTELPGAAEILKKWILVLCIHHHTGRALRDTNSVDVAKGMVRSIVNSDPWPGYRLRRKFTLSRFSYAICV